MKGDREVHFESHLEQGDFFGIKHKVSLLQKRIRKLEEAPSGDKKFETERKRIPEKSAISCCVEVKGKTDYFRNRNKELEQEVELLCLEKQRLTERSEHVQEMRKSYTVLERELRTRQSDRLAMRGKLDMARTRNEQLAEELRSLREDLCRMTSKVADDDMLLEALTGQQGNFHDLIERQKMLCQSDHRRFCEDLRELQTKHTTHLNLLDQLQEMSDDSDCLLERLRHTTPLTIYVIGETDEVDIPTVTSSSVLQLDGSTGVISGAPENPPPQPSDEVLENLKKEHETLRQIFQSSQEEIERLLEIAASNNDKLNEWRGQLLHSRALYIQRTVEVRSLEENRSLGYSSTTNRKENELLIKRDMVDEEHRFLVDFWHAVVAHSTSLFLIYTTSVDRTKKLFVDALRKLESELDPPHTAIESPPTLEE